MPTSQEETKDTELGGADAKGEERQVGEKASLDLDAEEEKGPVKKKQRVTGADDNGDDTNNPAAIKTEEKDEKKEEEKKQPNEEAATKTDTVVDQEDKEEDKNQGEAQGVTVALKDPPAEDSEVAPTSVDAAKRTTTVATSKTATPEKSPITTTTVTNAKSTTTKSKPPRTKKVAKPKKSSTTSKNKKTEDKNNKKKKSAPTNVRGMNPPWEDRYQQLLEFKKEFGHTNVPQNYTPNPALGHWVRNQRSRYKRYMEIVKKKKQNNGGKGEKEEDGNGGKDIDVAEEGKDIDVAEEETEVGSEEVKDDGTVKETSRTETNEALEAKLLNLESEDSPQKENPEQEEEEKDPDPPKGEYSKLMEELAPSLAENIRKLDEIGFEWIARNRARYVTWQQRFNELLAYYEEHGTSDLPQPPNDTQYTQLKLWCQTQRTSYMHYKQGKPSQMNRDRIKKLESLDFNWNGQRKTTSFQVRLKELKEFKLKFGDVSVPKKFRANPGLGIWCHEKRRLYKSRQEGHKTSLTDKQIEQLDKLGFVWSFKGQPYNAWDRYFRDLIQYKAEFGNCFVPKDFQRNKRLANWVEKQRANHLLKREGKPSPMTDEQQSKLEKLNFFKVSWRAFVDDLKEFKAINASCNVPQSYKTPRTNLGQWVMRQRAQYRLFTSGEKSQLDERKVKELEEIGFDWGRGISTRQRTTKNKKWDEHLEELKKYKEKFGSADVQISNGEPKEYVRLAGWTNHQRTEYLKFTQGRPSYLTEERVAIMNELGFNWTLRYRKVPWEERIAELKKYKEKHGHLHVPKRMGNLGTWCHERRKQYKQYEAGKKCSMSTFQIKELEDLGFVFHPTQQNFGRAGRKKSAQENSSEKKKSGGNQSNAAMSTAWPTPDKIPPPQLNVPPVPQQQGQTAQKIKPHQPLVAQLRQPNAVHVQPIPATQQQQQNQSLPQLYSPPPMPQANPLSFQQQMNLPIPHQNVGYPPQQNFQVQQQPPHPHHQQKGSVPYQMMPGAPYQPYNVNTQRETEPKKAKG